VIPGDGIGAEVIPEGVRVLKALAHGVAAPQLEFQYFDWGSDYYLVHGQMMPASGLEELGDFDAIYFGSAGDPRVPDHITLWELRLKICQGFEQYANVRPARLLRGVRSPLAGIGPKDLNCIIVRENSEGEYAGVGGRAHQNYPEELAVDVSVFTRSAVERIHRFAFELANSRPRRFLTLVTKSNAQRHGMVMWDQIFAEIASDYPDVTTDRVLVDAMTTQMVLRPSSLDVIVASNLHADILSDLAAALSGGLGLAPTANLRPERDHPSMFEPIHGSAFDLVGKETANPIGAFWTASMMLEHLGEDQGSTRLMDAIEAVTARGQVLPLDLGGKATTREVTDAVIAEIGN
jgi:tartrate dehydrogenase/decarboxylase/D-malate dehydrogenase